MTATPDSTQRRWWQVWRWPLAAQILLGLVVGVVVGGVIGASVLDQVRAGAKTQTVLNARWDFRVLGLLGGMFMDALRMLVVPLVVSAIITAVAAAGRQAGFARMGGKTVLYYAVSSVIAILIGIGLSNLIQPGATSDGRPLLTLDAAPALTAEADRVNAVAGGNRTAGDWLGVIRDLIPANILKAGVEGALLGLVTFSILFGLVLGRLENAAAASVRSFIDGVYQVMLGITGLVLVVAPIGVFGLMATTVAEQYANLAGDARIGVFIGAIAWFAVTVIGGLLLHALVVLPLALMLIARVDPRRHFRAMFPALLTAFSSASSAATLPVTIDRLEHGVGVSNRVASFTLPLGATVNMDGTALYECAAALFVAQCYGIDLGFAQQFSMLMLALLTSVGVAGVPAASLVAIIIILQNAGVPVEGLALVLITDRILDMCRTTVNVLSDSVGAVLVAVSEGERPLGKESPPPSST
ncbi:MAG: dicarboxylate/amino acid:cation symporter [Planctomycetes bacterium]|nr:dicarboxylate/amino acid:cation symporter [Planctomycetota bacterium]